MNEVLSHTDLPLEDAVEFYNPSSSVKDRLGIAIVDAAEESGLLQPGGVRSVLASCAAAKKKGLSVVSGLCLRYDSGFRATVRRLHEGAVGDVLVLQANDYRGSNWGKPRQPGWTDMQYQMRNWYNFTWLSGDFNVEQHVHYLDVCAWVMKNQYPVKAVGMEVESIKLTSGLFGGTSMNLARMTGPGRVGIQSMYVHHTTE